MKFVIDQSAPRQLAALLQSAGHVAVHTGDIGMAQALDEQIIDVARDMDAVVVTIDSDFHALLATSSALRPSVIRLRVQAMPAEQMARIVVSIVDSFSADLQAGAVATADIHSIRVRRLPLGSRGG